MESMEQYKKKVKENIEVLINSNSLEEAKNIINEYEAVVPKDEEVYSFKAVIAMMEGDINKAENVLKEGVALYPTSFDLLYNLGCLYETNNKSDAAIYYGRAFKYSKDEELNRKNYCSFSDNKNLENIFNVACESSKKRFIILSSCGWSDIYQRMHHISRSLVKLGNEVIYITPPISATSNDENVTLNYLNDYSTENQEIVDGVNVCRPISVEYNGIAIANNYTSLVQSLLDKPTDSTKTVIVTYMPHQVDTIRVLNGEFVHIYECVDDHSDLDYAYWGNKKDVVWEQELMDSADAITTTATSLYLQRVAIEKRKNVYFSRNAVNEGDFIISDINIPEDLKKIPEPRIVYTGAIYDWFDKELFYDVVKSNPDKSFVVIGFGSDKVLDEKCNNLFVLGPRKHNELKLYLKYCQASIIPFRDDIDLIVNCDPIKQYEYIACGLPVITTYMPEAIIGKINTFLANKKESFNEAIEKSLKFKADSEAIENFLIENSWNERAALLCNIADDKISELEKDKLIKNIQNKLNYICGQYDSAIFKTLKGISINLEETCGFEKSVEEAYGEKKYKYIEKQYLTALFFNKNMDKFISVAEKSMYTSEALKKELLHIKEISDDNRMNIVANICIGRIKEAILLVNELNDEKVKEIYSAYIRMLLGEEIKCLKNRLIYSQHYKNPLATFLCEKEKANKKSVTVLIPTKDRPELLERCVEYFYNMSDEQLEVQIFIVDASNEENSKINRRLENRYGKVVSHFTFDEDSKHPSRILKVCDKITTDFCCICADDDFLSQEGIVESIDILSKHKDIITVKGKSFIFLNNDTSKVYYFPKDSCSAMIDDDPRDRLNKLVSRWVPQLYYLVFRKKDLQMMEEILVNYDNGISDVFREYLSYFIIPLFGKVVNVEQPLNIRDQSLNSLGYSTPGFYKHVVHGDFNKNYNIMKDVLMIISDKYNLQLTSDYVDKIFTDLLINSWGISEEYINLHSSNFEIELLKKGFEQVNNN